VSKHTLQCLPQATPWQWRRASGSAGIAPKLSMSLLCKLHWLQNFKPRQPSLTIELAASCCSTRSWPRITFRLPASLSAAGNIYRAQLLLAAKPEGCEQLWAAGRAGASCGQPGDQQQQQQLGEPYRAVS
jgi:hypothetical protein